MWRKFIKKTDTLGLKLKGIMNKFPKGIKFLFVIILFFLSWLGWYYGIKADSPFFKNEKEIVYNDACNRFSEGCTLDLINKENNSQFQIINKNEKKIDTFYQPIITIHAAGNFLPHYNLDSNYHSFPRPNLFDYNQKSPYKFRMHGDKLELKGHLVDYKAPYKPLGSFDENEFIILHNFDGGCTYAFNKDNRGIEIVNTNQEVCFSLNIIDGIYYFKGYFVDENRLTHIYGDGFKAFSNHPDSTSKYLKRIQPIFDHVSLSDTLGLRL